MEETEEKLLERLRNTGLDHEPFLVCFSGVPVSGKSTLAKLIQGRYSMVRIENDKIREILGKDDVYGFLHRFLERYDQDNERIVLDSSIDRNYRELMEVLEKKGYPVYLIETPVPEDIDERLMEREGVKWDEWADQSFEKYLGDHEKASKELDYSFRHGVDGGVKELQEDLDERFRERILFICTGNSFRSPAAEALTRKYHPYHEVESAGTSPADHIAENMKKILEGENAVKFVKPSPDILSRRAIEEADRIVCMMPEHREFLGQEFEVGGNVEVWNVRDPIEQGVEPDESFSEIKQKVREI